MSNWTTKLTQTREVLTTLYPNREDGELIVDMAGIPSSFIDLSGKPRNMWHKILKEALKRNKVSDIVQIAHEEYPDNEALLKLFTDVEEKEPMTSASNLNAELYGSLIIDFSNETPTADGQGELELKEALLRKHIELKNAKSQRGEGFLDNFSYKTLLDQIEKSILELLNKSNIPILKPIINNSTPAIKSAETYDILVPNKEGLQKVQGSNDLTDLLWWVEKAKQTSMAVCKIETTIGEKGTGFLLKGGFLMTNNHVIPSADEANNSRIIFNYKIDKDKNVLDEVVYNLDSSQFITSDKDDLDYSIIKIIDNDEHPLSNWGNVEIEDFFSPNVNEKVTIIQHPDGKFMKMALPDNIISVWDKYLFYVTDTKEGSSGSPVFNKEWKVVALHHAGKNETDIGGGLQINEAGDVVPSNRGILIKNILDDLKEKNFTHNIV